MFKLDTILKWLLKWLKDPKNLKQVACYIGAFLFSIPMAKLAAAWDLLVELAQAAAKAFPGKGTGADKYNWLEGKFREALPHVKGLVMDYLLHHILPMLEKEGKKT